MWRVTLVLLLTACAQRVSEPPVTPVVPVGKAWISGTLTDLSHLPVKDMRVSCPESDAAMVTGDDGKWSLEVPSDSSITVRAVPKDPLDTSNVFKDVTFGPFQLSNKARLDGLELLSVPGSTIGGLNAIASGDEVRGVLAVTIVSLSGRCTPEGGTLALAQSKSARAVYVVANSSQPDRNLTAIQANTYPHGWLAGIAPGTWTEVKFTKPGCTQLPYPVAHQKVSWGGGFRLSTKGLAQVTVFVE